MKAGDLYILAHHAAEFSPIVANLFPERMSLPPGCRLAEAGEIIIVLQRRAYGIKMSPYYKVLTRQGITFCRLSWTSNLFMDHIEGGCT